jgi:hypothetical protein
MTNEELLKEKAELVPDRVVMKRRGKKKRDWDKWSEMWHCPPPHEQLPGRMYACWRD